MMLLSLLVGAALLSGANGPAVRYIDASLTFEERLLGQQFVDLDGGRYKTLCVALGLPDGGRELRLYPQNARGLDVANVRSIAILEDVLAYTFADVREEEGPELVFLTRTGAWSYSLTLDGYRGNIQRLVEDELLYDVPDDGALPFWKYVLPNRAGDRLLLPGRDEISIWERSADPAESGPKIASYADRVLFERTGKKRVIHVDKDESVGEITIGGAGGVQIRTGVSRGLFLAEPGRASTLLRNDKSYNAPALLDIDGDGQLDLVALVGDRLRIHIAREGRVPEQPTRIEELPDYLQEADADTSFEFLDFDGDGDQDLRVQIEGDVSGFDDAQVRMLFLINDGVRLIPETPDQVLRFEAASLRSSLADVNGDGRADLILRKFNLPSMIQAVTGLEFKLTYLIFLAEDGGARPFERKPAFKQTQIYDEETVADVVANRRFDMDCDGDGIPDLIEVDLQGRIAIRRLEYESGFFSGDGWTLDESPWKRFETAGSVLALETEDANGDGLADILSPGAHFLALHLSSRVR